LISKPPEKITMTKIITEIKKSTKPVIINFLGKTAGYCDVSGKSVTVNTLEEAAHTAANYTKTGKLANPKVHSGTLCGGNFYLRSSSNN